MKTAAFFLSHSNSILSRPICSNRSAWRASASAEAAFAGLPKTDSAPAADAHQAELFEQIGRLKMELEWVKKKAAAFL